MAAKKNIYSEADLEWAEAQLQTWREYIDAHPIHELTDRVAYKETKTGGVIPMVIQTIEAQIKAITELLKNYLLLLKEVEMMREKEEAKGKNVRGNQGLSPFESGAIK